MSPLPVVVDIALPPAVEESRIKKVAQEVQDRAKYIDAFVTKAQKYNWMALHAANQSGMSDAAFRLFFTLVAHGKEDGTSIFPSQKCVASVMGWSESSVKRASKKLEEDGWLISKRQRRGPAIKEAAIPDHIAAAIVKEILEVSNLTLLERPIQIPNLKRPQQSISQDVSNVTHLKAQEVPKLAPIGNQEVSNSDLRSVKFDQQENQNKNQDNIILYPRTRESLDKLMDRLFEAGGKTLNRGHAGFLSLGDPLRWLDNGCDLEADIVPAIRKATAAKRYGQICGWGYFTQAVLETRDRRLAPMQTPQVARGSPSEQGNSFKSKQQLRDEQSRQVDEDMKKYFVPAMQSSQLKKV
jgi:biotin operon repressor